MTTSLSTTTPFRFDPVSASCVHLDAIRTVLADAPGCSSCVADGATWIHLRICMTCGHVGCCDDSPNRHARAHYTHSAHPIMRSVEPGETWGWCYPDDELLFSNTHATNTRDQPPASRLSNASSETKRPRMELPRHQPLDPLPAPVNEEGRGPL
jgi:hypothetical protein